VLRDEPRWNGISTANGSSANRFSQAARSENRVDFLCGTRSSGCWINSRMRCMSPWWTTSLAFSRKYRIILRRTISIPSWRPKWKGAYNRDAPALVLSVIIPEGFQLSSSFHVGKTNALSFPRWNFYWRSPVTWGSRMKLVASPFTCESIAAKRLLELQGKRWVSLRQNVFYKILLRNITKYHETTRISYKL